MSDKPTQPAEVVTPGYLVLSYGSVLKLADKLRAQHGQNPHHGACIAVKVEILPERIIGGETQVTLR